jgi:hypothetical protein
LFAQRSWQTRPAERSRSRPARGEDNPNHKGVAGQRQGLKRLGGCAQEVRVRKASRSANVLTFSSSSGVTVDISSPFCYSAFIRRSRA